MIAKQYLDNLPQKRVEVGINPASWSSKRRIITEWLYHKNWGNDDDDLISTYLNFPACFPLCLHSRLYCKKSWKIAEIMSDEELSAEEALLKQQRKEKKDLQVIYKKDMNISKLFTALFRFLG